MLLGMCSLAFGGPNVGKRPVLRHVTPRMLLPDVSLSELTNMPHVASAVCPFAAPSILLSVSSEVSPDYTGVFTLAGFSASEVAVISTIVAGFSIALGWTNKQIDKVCDRPPPPTSRRPLSRR